MARTATAQEARLLDLEHRTTHLRVRVENAVGQPVDLSNLYETNWITAANWGGDVDKPVSDARVFLMRSQSLYHLSPFAAGRANAGAAPLLAPYRAIWIDTQVTAQGRDPDPAAWQNVFEGLIDAIDPAQGNQIRVDARDNGGYLQDLWLEDQRHTYGATPAGSAVETEMQQLIDDWAGASRIIPRLFPISLYTPTSPGWQILEYKPDVGPIMEELTRVAAQIGWVVRYRWDNGTSSWRLTFFSPDRSATLPAVTFNTSRIRRFREYSINLAEIRNVVRVWYSDANIDPTADDRGGRRYADASDSASAAAYGRRWMQIAEASTSNISTSTEAQALADAAIADLGQPLVTGQFEVPYDWRPELFDLVQVVPDSDLGAASADIGVMRIRHRWTNTTATTTITGRGKPAAYATRWQEVGGRPGGPRVSDTEGPEAPALSAGPRPGGITLSVDKPLGPRAREPNEYELHVSDTPSFVPSSSTLTARGSSETWEVNGPPGETQYAQVLPVDRWGNRNVTPGNEITITHGQAGLQFLNPASGIGLPRGMDLSSRGSRYPADGWRMRSGDWDNDGAYSTVSQLGSRSLEFSGDTNQMETTRVQIRAGAPVLAFLRWQSDTVGGGETVQVEVEFYAAQTGGSPLSTVEIFNDEAAAADTWQDATDVLTAPAGAMWAQLVVTLGATGFKVLLDEVRLEEAPEAFHAYLGTGATLTDDAWTQHDLDTEDFDHGGVYDDANFEFAVPRTGDYDLNAQATFLNGTGYVGLRLLRNSILIAINVADTSAAETLGTVGVSVSRAAMRLDAGDVITAEVVANGGGSASTVAGRDNTYFSGRRVG